MTFLDIASNSGFSSKKNRERIALLWLHSCRTTFEPVSFVSNPKIEDVAFSHVMLPIVEISSRRNIRGLPREMLGTHLRRTAGARKGHFNITTLSC